MENKKIIGYRLKDEKYRKPAEKVCGYLGSEPLEYYVSNGEVFRSKLKEAEVLDIWFEPVYEEKELEVGKWYKLKNDCIAYYQGIGKLTCGINPTSISGMRWIESDKWFNKTENSEYAIIATDKEVEEALIEEAKKRGFKSGVTVDAKNLSPLYYKIALVSGEFRLSETGQLCLGKHAIFRDGKWAEIVSTELPEINGYKGEIKSDSHISYGCAEIPFRWFTESYNRKITSFTLDSGVTINEKQVNQIRKYLNENK